MHVILSIFLTSLLVPLSLRLIVFKSQSLKSSSSYTFSFPKYLSVFFLISALLITAFCVGVFLQDHKAKLELEIFLLSCYTVFIIAIVSQFLKTLNFQLILEEDCMIYKFMGEKPQNRIWRNNKNQNV